MNGNSVSFETRCLSSLSKVFPTGELTDAPFTQASALCNETYSFQVAYRSNMLLKGIRCSSESDFSDCVTLREVGLVPSELPVYEDHDDAILTDAPGLYPDPLFPVDKNLGISLPGNQWRSMWVTVRLDGSYPRGDYPITIRFESESGETLGQETFHLRVIGIKLPEQELIHTEWFHGDCLANYYKVEVFSEEHWGIMERYVESAVRHGINMLLTPIFTPPLDTQIGGERLNVQLVDVEKTEDGYRFGFDRLARWVDMCDRQGVRYFEFSHLFTQWGAKHAPKIMANVNGEMRRIFGWDTDARGDEYKHFLSVFLPELVSYIRSRGLEGRCYFHISDEPVEKFLPWYESASQWVKRFIDDFPVIDALSDYAFYEKGLVKQPIPASNHIEEFLDHKVNPLWTYYCCSQYKEVSNRFFCFPSSRNRVIGLQLYKFNIAGFLHWGFNFWNTQLSRKAIDPYRVTDAGMAFPSGDAFLVYPGEDGPVESIRMEVFHEALQDLRALRLLEGLIGKERILEHIEKDLDQTLTFKEYPIDSGWLHQIREWVNSQLEKWSS